MATITAGMQSSTRVCTLVVARQLELQLYLPSVLGYLFVTLFSACELPLGAARPLIAWDTGSKPPWRAIVCAMGQRLHVVCSWQRPRHPYQRQLCRTMLANAASEWADLLLEALVTPAFRFGH